MKNPELSIILPCRNEEQALPRCLKQIKKVILQSNIDAEIIVSDSSIDRSPEIAKKHGVRLVKHDKKGYGIAYLEGIRAAKGKFILMADADCTYDFNDIPKFLHFLKQGNDLVIGNRFGKKLGSGISRNSCLSFFFCRSGFDLSISSCNMGYLYSVNFVLYN